MDVKNFDFEGSGASGLGKIEKVFGEGMYEAKAMAAGFFSESFRSAGRFYLHLRDLERAGSCRLSGPGLLIDGSGFGAVDGGDAAC